MGGGSTIEISCSVHKIPKKQRFLIVYCSHPTMYLPKPPITTIGSDSGGSRAPLELYVAPGNNPSCVSWQQELSSLSFRLWRDSIEDFKVIWYLSCVLGSQVLKGYALETSRYKWNSTQINWLLQWIQAGDEEQSTEIGRETGSGSGSSTGHNDTFELIN